MVLYLFILPNINCPNKINAPLKQAILNLALNNSRKTFLKKIEYG